jgi:co-chaperonin GroES (HSP10)
MNPLKDVKIRPIRDKVLVTDMEFGEMKTAGGLIIKSDDGKAHGVKPRWGKVYAVGPEQTDVQVGQWVLVEHGRWTRGMDIIETDENGDEVKRTIRMVENKAMLIISDEKPNTAYIGAEYSNGSSVDIKPEDFVDSGRAF